MCVLLLSIGFVIGSIVTIVYREVCLKHRFGGTIIVKEGFQEGIIEQVTIRFSIPEEKINSSKSLYFRVKHE